MHEFMVYYDLAGLYVLRYGQGLVSSDEYLVHKELHPATRFFLPVFHTTFSNSFSSRAVSAAQHSSPPTGGSENIDGAMASLLKRLSTLFIFSCPSVVVMSREASFIF